MTGICITHHKKWFYPALVALAGVYCAVRNSDDAEAERVALWVMRTAVEIKVNGEVINHG